jgi:Flp pilus assembly pilin Flp
MLKNLTRWKVSATHCCARFQTDEFGATAVEYALISILLGVPLLLTSSLLSDSLVGLLMSVADALEEVAAGP